MFEWVNAFHFIRPWWLLLLVPFAGLIFWHLHNRAHQSGWVNVIEPELLKLMTSARTLPTRRARSWLLPTFALLGIVALAGPSWTQLPKPLFESQAARMIVLDLSLSMDSIDVEPSRMTRAKYKLLDLLDASDEGQVGLVVYAGDAFIISPLTTDADTVAALVRPLSTRIMPVLGSRPDLGLQRAAELLENAGALNAEIIWITDGVDASDKSQVADALRALNYPVKILLVGTAAGAPIPTEKGGNYLKDAAGNIVVPKVDNAAMESLANLNNGEIFTLSSGNDDIELLLRNSNTDDSMEATQGNRWADQWEDAGYWLIIPLLLILLVKFARRETLLTVAGVSLLGLASFTVSSPTTAAELESLWLNQDQRAHKRLADGNPSEAAEMFLDEQWRAAAQYRAGQFQSAAESYSSELTTDNSASAHYNRGNALTQLGEYDQAIAAYDAALNVDPELADAEHNKNIAQQLKELEEQQQQSESQENGEEESEQQSEQEQSESEAEQQEPEQESDQQSQSESEQQQQAEAQEQTSQEYQAQFEEDEKDQELEQWLRKIDDDPGGLLRRKMRREYIRRGRENQEEKIW